MTYVVDLLSRFGCVPEQTMLECVEKMVHSIERIKACYAESTPYNDLELAKMMVIDACFILGFIQSLVYISSKHNNELRDQCIAYDILLIENQIPFFVLENIFECTMGRMVKGASLTTHIEVLVDYLYDFFDGNRVVPPASPHDHILGFVHRCYQPLEAMPSVPISAPKRHSAMELHRAGMNFKPNEDQNWAMAMKLELPSPLFSWFLWPTLRLPKVCIHSHSKLVFRNLIIYEQFADDVKKYVTSYLFAMDMLIDTPQDVAMLVESKVLRHRLGSNEEVANMINQVNPNVLIGEFFYGSQWEEMDAYYNSTIARLKRTFSNNP